MLRIGASGEYFYQRNRDNAGFCIRIYLTFREQVDPDAMKKAATLAARLYPELCFRPVWKGGKVVPVSNENEVCFYEDEGKSRSFGTEETGGYLFYFTGSGRELVFHMFHGVTDVKGAMAYLRTVFYYYYHLEDLPKEDPFFTHCRTNPDALTATDDEDMYDPYRKYADMSSEPPVLFTGPAFQIPEDVTDPSGNWSHQYRITLRTSDYLKKTKEYGASFASFLHILSCDAVDRAYDMGEELFIGMLPADMRSYFGSDTMVNFSDSIMLPQTAKDRKKDVGERGRKLKEEIRKRLTAEYFSALMADKVRNVESFTPPEPSSKPENAPTRIFTPFTIGISAPGRQEIGGGVDEHIENIVVTGSARVLLITQSTFGDIMTICVVMKNDNTTLPYAVRDTLESYGISCELTDDGRVYTDQVCTEKLERIG